MKKLFFILLAINLIIVSCKDETKEKITDENISAEAEETKSLQFSSENINQNSFEICKENECPKVEISFLTAKGKAPISEKINKANEEYIINIFNSTPDPSEAKTIKEAAKLFMDDYFQYRNEFPEARADYEAEISQEQLVKTDSLLTYKTKFYLFTGGAHGYGATRFLNFNLKNGERLKNSQLFKDEESFTKYAETKFREKFNIPTGESINQNGFFFNEDKFQLSENIAITKDEVLLIYNPYEAASYAEGQLELNIAKSEVEEFLNY
jgi:hypothetical protein